MIMLPSPDRWIEAILPRAGAALNYLLHTHAALMLPADFFNRIGRDRHFNRWARMLPTGNTSTMMFWRVLLA